MTSVQCPQLAAVTTVVAAQLFLPTTQPVHSATRDGNEGSRRYHNHGDALTFKTLCRRSTLRSFPALVHHHTANVLIKWHIGP